MIFVLYLKSLLRHKWFVFLAGLKTGVPIWRLIVHDWSKFLPSEFIPYARHFFGKYPENSEVPQILRQLPSWTGRTKEQVKDSFDRAWLLHQNRNPHHWQFWILVYDDEPEKVKALQMPETYVREMIADWMGASMTYTGSWDMTEWLGKNGPRTIMHEATVRETHTLLIELLGYRLQEWQNASG